MPTTPDQQLHALRWNAAEVVPADGLASKLAAGRSLRVKLGLDPTASHVTLGWAVVLRKLKEFQEFGHTAVLIVGDFTARIGDPSEQDRTRPMLSRDEVEEYTQRVLEQLFLILDRDRTEIRRNSEWLEALGVEGLLELASHQTVARTLQRDDFAQRYAAGAPISLREFVYPLLQGYDSVAVRADIELGGTDQHFNLLVGRHLQRAYDQEPQAVMTMPLIEGTDGVRKMSQSLGNHIAITDEPDEIFGKIMSLPDALMDKYFRLTSGLLPDEIEAIANDQPRPEVRKRILARQLVRLYHGDDAASRAAERFDKIFRAGEIPGDIPDVPIPDSSVNGSRVYLPRLLAEIGFTESNSAARRVIAQGGVYIDGRPLDGEELEVEELRGKVIALGKRHFARMV